MSKRKYNRHECTDPAVGENRDLFLFELLPPDETNQFAAHMLNCLYCTAFLFDHWDVAEFVDEVFPLMTGANRLESTDE